MYSHRRWGNMLLSLFGKSSPRRAARVLRRRRPQLLLEPLEERRLLDAKLTMTNGVLAYAGDSGANTLQLSLTNIGGNETYTFSANVLIDYMGNSSDQVTVPSTGVTAVQINLPGTSNSLTLGTFDTTGVTLSATDTNTAPANDTATVSANLQIQGGLSLQGFGADQIGTATSGPISIMTSGAQLYADPVALGAAVSLTSTASANPVAPGVQLISAVGGAGNSLTVSAPDAGSEFDAAVSGVSGLTIAGPTLLAGDVTSSGAGQSYGPVVLAADVTLQDTAGGAITFHSTIDASASGGQSLKIQTDGTTTFDDLVGSVAAPNTLTVEGFTANSAGQIDLDATDAATITTAGGQDYFSPVSLGSDQALDSTAAGNITFHSTVDATTAGGQGLTTSTDGTTTFDGLVGGSFALKTLTTEGESSSPGGLTHLAAAGVVTIQTSGDQDFENAVELDGNQVLSSTGAGAITFQSSVDAATAGGESLTTETDGAATFDGLFGGNFALSSLTVEGKTTAGTGFTDLNATGAPTIRTTADQDFENPVTLSSDQVVVSTASGNITFHTTVDGTTAGGQALTTETDGVTTLLGPVGNNFALSSLTIEGETASADGATQFGATGAATISTSGNQDYFNAVTITADQILVSSTAGNITFHSTVDAAVAGGQALTTKTDGTATLDGVVGSTFALKTLTIEGESVATGGLTTLDATGAVTVDTTGAQDYFNPVALGNSQVLTSTGSGNLTFHSTVDALVAGEQGLTTSTDGTTTFDDDLALESLTVKGNTANSDGDTVLNATGTSTVRTTGGQDYFNPLTLENNQVLISTGSGNITFHTTVDAAAAGGQSLIVRTDETTTFDGPVGSNFALSSLVVEGNTTDSSGATSANAAGVATFNSTGDQDYFNPLTLSHDQVFLSNAAGNITFHATVDASTGGGQSLTSETDGTTTLDGVVGGNFALKSLLIEGFSTVASGTADLNAVSAVATVRTVGTQDYFNPLRLSNDQVLASTGAADITFHATVDATVSGGQALTVKTDGASVFLAPVGSTESLKSLSTEGDTTDASGTTDVNPSGAGSITTAGSQDYFNPLTLSTNVVFISIGSGTMTFHTTVDALTSGGETLTSMSDGATLFDGVAGGNFALKTLTVEGFSSASKGAADLNAIQPGGTIRTTGDQDYFDPVSLGNNQLLASSGAGDITFHSTVDAGATGGQALTTQTDGTATFDGVVGGALALESLTVEGKTANSSGFTDLDAAAITTIVTTGDQDYFNPVTLGADQGLDSTDAGAVTFHGTVDATVAGAQGLVVLTDGKISLLGVVGGSVPLAYFRLLAFSGGAGAPIDLNQSVTTAGGGQTYEATILSVSVTLTDTDGGAIQFQSTIDATTSGAQGLVVDTDGTSTFDGAVGGMNELMSLTVEGFTDPGDGNTVLAANGALTVQTTGAQDYFNPIALVMDQTLVSTAIGNITFHSTVDAIAVAGASLTVRTDGVTTLDGVVGDNDPLQSLSVGGLTLPATGSTVLAANAPGATVQTGGSQDYFNTTILAASQELAAIGGGNTTFHSTVNDLVAGAASLTSVTGGATTFDGVVGGSFALQSLTVQGFVLTSSGTTDFEATNAGPTVTTTGGQNYFNPVTLGATQMLVSTASGNTVFHTSLDGMTAGSQSLTTKTDGMAAFDGAVGGTTALQNLAVEGFTTAASGTTQLNAGNAGPTVRTTANQDYFNATALGASQTLVSTLAGNTTFHSTVDGFAAGADSLTSMTDGTVTFDGIVGGNMALLSLSAEGMTINSDGTTLLDAVSAGATVRTTGSQDYFNPATLGASQMLVSTSNGDTTFHTTVDDLVAGSQSLTTRTDGTTAFDGVVGGSKALQSVAAEGFTTPSDGTTELNASNIAATVTTTGSQDYFNPALLGVSQMLVSTAAGDTTFHMTVDGSIAGSDSLTSMTNGTTAFDAVVGGSVALQSLASEGFTTNSAGTTELNAANAGPTVRTTGNQDYFNPAALGNSQTLVSLAGGNNTFHMTVDGMAAGIQSLASVTNGQSVFDGVVGGTGALQNFTVEGFTNTSSGTTLLNASSAGPTITTSGNQEYFNPAILGLTQKLVNTAGGSNTFFMTVDGTVAGGQQLTSMTNGMTTFYGAVGGSKALQALMVEGMTAPGMGHTMLGATSAGAGKFSVTTAGFAKDSSNQSYGQEYANAVTLMTTNGLQSMNSSGNIIFGSTVDGSAAHMQSIDLSTPSATVMFNGAVGMSEPLTTVQLNVGAKLTQPNSAPFVSNYALLQGSASYDLSKAANQIGTLAAAVTGSLSFQDMMQLTIATVDDVLNLASTNGVTTQNNPFAMMLGQGTAILQPVNTGTSAITATLGMVAGGQVVTNIDSELIARVGDANPNDIGAMFDGSLSKQSISFFVQPSPMASMKLIGTNPIGNNSLTLQNTGSVTATLTQTGPRSGFFTYDPAFLTTFYANIDNFGQFTASATATLNSFGLPSIQVTAAKVGSLILTIPIPFQTPAQNPFIISPGVNSPFTAGAPRLAFAPVIGSTIPDLIIANGPGAPPLVTVINGATLFTNASQAPNLNDPTIDPNSAIVAEFYAFQPSYLGGVNIAAADLDGSDNNTDEIITAQASGQDSQTDPQINVYSLVPSNSKPLYNPQLRLSLNPFAGFGGGVEVAAINAVAGANVHGLIFVAPGPGPIPDVINAYDGITGRQLGIAVYPFGTGYTGGIALSATNTYEGTSEALLAGMMTGGSAIDLYAYEPATNFNQLYCAGQISAAFPSSMQGRVGPLPGTGTPPGVGSVAFGPAVGSILAGTAFAQNQNAEGSLFANIDNSQPMATVLSNPFPAEVQITSLLTLPTTTSIIDAAPTVSSDVTNDPPVAPGASTAIHFNVSSAVYSNQLTVTAISSNPTLLPDSDLVLTNAGGSYTLTVNAPTGSKTGTATVTVIVTDPRYLSTSTNFAITIDDAPVLPAINSTNSVVLSDGTMSYSTALGASSPDGNPLTYSATVQADSLLYDLQQQYHFQGIAYYTNTAAAYVIHSDQPGSGVGGYYLIRPSNGAVYPYDGSGSYSHSYDFGQALAVLGANVYTDPSLLLNAQPPADYATLYSIEQQYQFQGVSYYANDAAAYVLKASTDNSYGNPYYLLSATDGALVAYDGSGSYAHSFANGKPITVLGPALYSDPSELIDAKAPPAIYDQLSQLNQQFDLQEYNGSFYVNTAGHQAEWFYSPVLNQYGQHWYTLTLSSDGSEAYLRAWEGDGDSETGNIVATLDPSVYANPTWLSTATYLADPNVTATIDSAGNLSVALPNSSFTGTFQVDVTASDGLLSTSQVVTFQASHTALIAVQQGSTPVPAGSAVSAALGSSQQFTVATTDSANAPVTSTASVATYDPLFSLEQEYRFQGLAYYSNTAPAYVLQAAGNNRYGNPYYLLNSSGELYAYDGSGSYAHSYANGSALADLGATVYNDPDLLLRAQAPVDYTTIYNLQQQYQFQGVGYYTYGATAYVLHSNQPGTGFEGYYLLTANGNLYAFDGSTSYAHAIDNSANLVAALGPSVYENPAILLNATTAPSQYAQLAAVEGSLDLQEYQGAVYTGQLGNAAKWLYSPTLDASGYNWYTLVLSSDGAQALLYAWDGGKSSVPSGAAPVATFDASVYYNPALLVNAKVPVAAVGATATLNNGVLTVNTPAGYIGTLQVTLTASDGGVSAAQAFLVTTTDTPPVVSEVPAQTASQSGAPLQVTLGSNSSNSQPVTYTATVAGYSAAYDLQRVYQFSGVGYFTVGGTTAYVLFSQVKGGFGGYYLMDSNGDIYAYDGSGSYVHTFANSANLVATLSSAVYDTPSLLTDAQVPAAPDAVVTLNGAALTVNVASVAPGTVFEVLVSAGDGTENGRSSFLVTVTA